MQRALFLIGTRLLALGGCASLARRFPDAVAGLVLVGASRHFIPPDAPAEVVAAIRSMPGR